MPREVTDAKLWAKIIKRWNRNGPNDHVDELVKLADVPNRRALRVRIARFRAKFGEDKVKRRPQGRPRTKPRCKRCVELEQEIEALKAQLAEKAQSEEPVWDEPQDSMNNKWLL